MGKPFPLRVFLRAVGLLLTAFLVYYIAAFFFAANWHSVFYRSPLWPQENRVLVYFLDPDCYTRMERVKRLDRNPQQVFREHTFENYPDGIRPHTTMPMDYAIWGLKLALAAAGISDALDKAGAFISPALGVLALVYLLWWGRGQIPGGRRWMAMLVFGVSPATAAAFSLGRPDHQSLALLLMLVATTQLYSLVDRGAFRRPEVMAPDQRRRNLMSAVLGGASLGLALWTSLYEPLVLAGVLLAWAAFQRPQWTRVLQVYLGTLVAVLAVFLLVEGWRIEPAQLTGTKAAPWLATIGELGKLSWRSMGAYFGWLFWLAPLLLIHAWRHRTVPRSYTALFGGGALALLALSAWQPRWLPFFSLFYALSVPVMLGSMRGKVWQWILLLVLLFPCFRYAAREGAKRPGLASAVAQQDQLRYLALSIPHDANLPILAPWWVSPQLLYWTGNPIVASSSHQSLEGIRDSAAFFSSLDPAGAMDILRKRGVKIVVAYDAPRLLLNSVRVLGLAPTALNEENIVDTEGYAYSVVSRLMDERHEDWLALDGNLCLVAYAGGVEPYKFRIFWVLDRPVAPVSAVPAPAAAKPAAAPPAQK